MEIRIGQGIDIHKIKEKKNHSQKLGGISFLLNYEIIANSDGDIILHSLSSAIAGALGFEELGYYFPDDKEFTKNMNSKLIFDFYFAKMKELNFTFSNIDMTIICEKIIFKEIKNEILENLKKICLTNNVSLKATRFEEDKKMMECHTTILICKNNT